MNDKFLEKRILMVNNQILSRGITNNLVLNAMKKVERHKFVSNEHIFSAYSDNPLPAGFNQTISQPYIVAYMTEMLEIDYNSKTLEIGTGTGYQTAVLAEISSNIYTVERIKELSTSARVRLDKLGYDNIHYKVDSGFNGWEEYSPFERIIVTCAPGYIPDNLVSQMTNKGIMIIPVGNSVIQTLLKITKINNTINIEELLAVRFVPMI